MKFSTSVSISLAVWSSIVEAQVADFQSPPFNLVLISSNTTINGSTITSCHEGAAIEGLCLGPKYKSSGSFETYNFNTTDNSTVNAPGTLTWLLHASGGLNVSEGMELLYSPTTNVAHAQFFPGYSSTYVSFDATGLMYIEGYIDDTKVPPVLGNRAYYHWYVCQTDEQGYQYTTLNWAVGRGKPQNPSCVSVSVKRVFTKK